MKSIPKNAFAFLGIIFNPTKTVPVLAFASLGTPSQSLKQGSKMGNADFRGSYKNRKRLLTLLVHQ